jgi:hypothetical protein
MGIRRYAAPSYNRPFVSFIILTYLLGRLRLRHKTPHERSKNCHSQQGGQHISYRPQESDSQLSRRFQVELNTSISVVAGKLRLIV